MIKDRMRCGEKPANCEVFSNRKVAIGGGGAQTTRMETITQMETLNDRDATIKIIRSELKRRSGKTWSVNGSRGTAWGWITINVPPAQRDEFDAMNDEAREELAQLLGLDYVHRQGVTIAASIDHRNEYIDRARGIEPSRVAQPYWD